MRLVIQRVSEAAVSIEGVVHGAINHGFMILVGIEPADTSEDIDWLVKKTLNLRIFNDEDGVMNKSILDVKGELLVISQFTLQARTKKGNRPSYINAAGPDLAIPLYEELINKLAQEGNIRVATGKFGANMQVQLINDGPVTILIDSKNKE
ncbi:D-aminoacyl-tRNA deacylase [Carboxylicivirga sp. M1479]|uniref:D-aminoacyl-tRNA deacylase n=1 Tax=Carboxylicivirga sp. M1479 TaxID=2594476 RepID=UPI0011788E8A|nr:D-aminoacyl-tRNA deacylase [Carboxylicivirga sp. M1479]TRX71668.1 D-tyrosyl-tRNA(Tyr) deacylase [Carboxylicivirga sp. M1479]